MHFLWKELYENDEWVIQVNVSKVFYILELIDHEVRHKKAFSGLSI